MPDLTRAHDGSPLRFRRLLGGMLLIAIVVVVLFGASIDNGLVLDDCNHRAELHEGDWSFRSLVHASHLGGVRRRVEMWWQRDADLYFFRPLAFLIMRCEYLVGGWRPAVMHGFSLGWTVVCATLVMAIAARVTGSYRWSLLAATLFVAHPGNYLTGRWIACQNEQMATAFILAGLLAYGRYAGWWRNATDAEGPTPGTFPTPLPRNPGTPRWALPATLACFLAALGCRENSIVFPVLVVVGDVALRRGGWRQRIGVYAGLAVVAVAYLALRHAMLGGLTIPGRPYAWPPGTPGFTRFIIDKFIYYVLGMWAFVPIVGFTGMESLREQPAVFYGLFAAIVLAWAVILRQYHGHRSIWLWLAVALVPLGPVLPIFASSHHLYLTSAGAIVASVLALQWLFGWTRERTTGATKLIRGALITALVTIGAICVGAAFVYEATAEGLSAASRLTIEQVLRFGRPMKPADKLFFINLPMLGFNCIPAIEEAAGASPLKGYVLTFAPTFVQMDQASYVDRVGDRQLRVWMGDESYFSGMIGQRILEGIGREKPFEVGETFHTDAFTVEVKHGSAAGIQEFLFTFEQPLDDPSYHFFFGSPMFDAYPVFFGNHQ